MRLDLDRIRGAFPALHVLDDGMSRIFLDNPAGTQVPEAVIQRISDYLIRCNANHGGFFTTSVTSDALLEEAHEAMADFINAGSGQEIIFGPNMTSLTFAMSRSLGHEFSRGQTIVVTTMDHDANVMPWVRIADDHGLNVKRVRFDRETYEFDLSAFQAALDGSVCLVAICHASNALGTINPVRDVCRIAHQAGALVYVDAVQSVPHIPVDVQELECDFLACSAYKFFGPHQGILWGRPDLLECINAYKVRPADDRAPGKFETGTQSHEGQAGTLGALEYLTWLLEDADLDGGRLSRKDSLRQSMEAIRVYETALSRQLLEGLSGIAGIQVHGVTRPESLGIRVPTVSFTHDRIRPAQIARDLAARNIFVWHGHYYAVEVVQELGLAETGGMVRVGPVHYNTAREIDLFLETLEHICRQA